MKLKRHIQFLNENNGTVHEGDFKATSFMIKDGRFIPDRIPEEITGDFNCANLGLISLEGGPLEVHGTYYCHQNDLTDLKGAPEESGFFHCSYNKLTTLEGGPESVENLECNNNLLTDLKGAPESVALDFNCSYNKLTTLEGCAEVIASYFYCHDNLLTDLKGGPIWTGGDYDCKNNKLTSLEGGPRRKDSGKVIYNGNGTDLKLERDYIMSGSYEGDDYWIGLLKYMIEHDFDLEHVKGWPKGFLNANIKTSAKGLKKFQL